MIDAKKVVSEVEAAVTEGWKITTGRFIDAEQKHCCPMGAFEHNCGNYDGIYVAKIAEKLNTTDQEVWAFADDFDMSNDEFVVQDVRAVRDRLKAKNIEVQRRSFDDDP